MSPTRCARQLKLWQHLICPENEIVLCIYEYEDYLEVLCGGKVFFTEKELVVVHAYPPGRYHSNAR